VTSSDADRELPSDKGCGRADPTTAAIAEQTEYDEGTAWPSSYDSHTTETLETSETVVEEIANPNLHTRKDTGVTIDCAMCWWDLPSSNAEGIT
jgi:hypothetical protein